MSHIVNGAAILEEARLLMEEKKQLLTEEARTTKPFPFFLAMLLAGFHLGCETTAAVKVLLASGDEMLHPAISCCRPFFELSLRLLWASRVKYGWDRLHEWFVREEIKWANLVIPIPELADVAKEILRTTHSVEGQKAENGTVIKAAPGFEQTLKDVEHCNNDDGIQSDFQPGFEYNFVYRKLCQYAHGHIRVILEKRPGRMRDWTVLVPCKSTLALIQCYHRTVGTDVDNDQARNTDIVRLLSALRSSGNTSFI